MTRRDALLCEHEPFGDAYYYGPERLAERFADDEQTRKESGFENTTYQTIMDKINEDNKDDKRIFIKDMAQYFVPPSGRPVSLAPSLLAKSGSHPARRASASHLESPSVIDTSARPAMNSKQMHLAPYPTPSEPNNPTVVPTALLHQFRFVFLIRHPRNSIPSYYRCTIPPLDKVTGFYNFRPDEAGYDELRRLFDYLVRVEQIGPGVAGQETVDGRPSGKGTGKSKHADICLIDADDLLDKPQEIIEAFCESVGIDYSPKMLVWDDEEQHKYAEETFEKWKGFHEDAIHSNDLKPRQHVR
jgi:hypothetical protein